MTQIRPAQYTPNPQGTPAIAYEYHIGTPNEDPTIDSNKLDVTDGLGGLPVSNPFFINSTGLFINKNGQRINPWINDTSYAVTVLSPNGGLRYHESNFTADNVDPLGQQQATVDATFSNFSLAVTSDLSTYDTIYIESELAGWEDTNAGPVDGLFAHSTGGTGTPSTGTPDLFYDSLGNEWKRSEQQKHVNTEFYYANESGAADAYVLDANDGNENPQSYFLGLRVLFVATNDNTGASTIDVAGLGVKDIKKSFGSSDDVQAGDISGQTELIYDGTSFSPYFANGAVPGPLMRTIPGTVDFNDNQAITIFDDLTLTQYQGKFFFTAKFEVANLGDELVRVGLTTSATLPVAIPTAYEAISQTYQGLTTFREIITADSLPFLNIPNSSGATTPNVIVSGTIEKAAGETIYVYGQAGGNPSSAFIQDVFFKWEKCEG